eukprot:4715432-Amphidinium_carterae.1
MWKSATEVILCQEDAHTRNCFVQLARWGCHLAWLDSHSSHAKCACTWEQDSKVNLGVSRFTKIVQRQHILIALQGRIM